MNDEITSGAGEVHLMEGTSTVQLEQATPSTQQATLFDDADTTTPAPAPAGTVAPAARPIKPAAADTSTPAPETARAIQSEPERKASSKSEKVDELLQTLNEQNSLVAEKHKRLERILAVNADRERLVYLREIGAKNILNDEDLLSMAPRADVTTPEGRAEIDRWRQTRSDYFTTKDAGETLNLDEIAKGIPSSPNGTFGPHNYRHIMTQAMRRNK